MMNLLRPLARGRREAAETALSSEGDGVVNAEQLGVQADARFLKTILMALAFTTCLLGAAAIAAMF